LDQRSGLQQIAFVLGTSFLLGGLAIIAFHSFEWLEHGSWPALPTSFILDALGMARPSTHWAVLQTVINWTLDRLPLWGLLFLLSAFFFGLS
jgi:hypothetical protein